MTSTSRTPFARLAIPALAVAALVFSAQGALAASKMCGLENGKKATGTPILVGSIVGQTGPDDFSAGAKSAKAYFDCVNANGGINGRPIEFLIEDDQWKPEVAAQVAGKLIKDKEDTEQVFHIFENLPRKGFVDDARAFVESDLGQRLMASEPYLPDLLDDHGWIDELPEGTDFGLAQLASVAASRRR